MYNKSMNKFKSYIEYLKDNPKGYWFKRKLYGWGWTPATWQGWLVLVIGIGIAFLGVYVGEVDDAPGASLLGVVLMVVFVITFSVWKGENPPRWQWGSRKEDE